MHFHVDPTERSYLKEPLKLQMASCIHGSAMHFFQLRWWYTPSRTVKQFLTNLTYLLVSTDTI